MSDHFPHIFTFYSYKGGVGRSMALLNVAYALAGRGRHVLVVDFDLEAPGVSGFMRRKGEVIGSASHDAIDLVDWACRAPSTPEASVEALLSEAPPFEKCHLPVPTDRRTKLKPRYGEAGRIDVIGVDNDRNYFDRLTKLDLHNKSRDELIAAGNALRAYLKAQRVPIEVPDYYPPDAPKDQPYDYVLIDSRTGTTEMGGLCVGPLSDRLVVFVGLNDQNVEGTRQFLDEIGLLGSEKGSDSRWDDSVPAKDDEDTPPSLGPKPTLIVASPVPYGEILYKQERLNTLSEALGQEVAAKLSYHPQMALMETLFVRDYPDEFLAGEYRGLSDEIMRLVRDHASQLGRDAAEAWTDRKKTKAIVLLLRAVTHQPDRLSTLINLWESFIPHTDEEYIAKDRLLRLLAHPSSPVLLNALGGWGSFLRGWAEDGLHAGRRNACLATAVESFTVVIRVDSVPAELRAQAMLERGVCFGQMDPPATEKAIADLTAAINMEGAPAEQKANALLSRGITFSKLEPPDTEKEIADYTTVINMKNAPTERKSEALLNRGVCFTQTDPPDIVKAIADYTAVIDMKNAPAEQRSEALLNRGVCFTQTNPPDIVKAIADYTAVINMQDAATILRAQAIVYRGAAYRQMHPPDTEKSIGDFTTVINMDDIPAKLRAQALVNRGITFSQLEPPETEKVIADYTAVINMNNAPVELRTQALGNLAWHDYTLGRLNQAISGSQEALIHSPEETSLRANLALYLLCVGRTKEALKQYRQTVDKAKTLDFLDDMDEDLEEAIAKRGTLPEADTVQGWIRERRAQL